MKTILTLLNINNNGIHQSITTKKSYTNNEYYQTYNQAAGDINRNATINQAEYERDACEEELYRLRYGIENLLSNNEQGDFKLQRRKSFANIKNPFRTMMSKLINLNDRKNKSWLDRCSPCCRRWRRNRRNSNIPNSSHSQRTPNSPSQSQMYSESLVSASPSPSISSPYINPNKSRKKNNLRRSISNLFNRNRSTRKDVGELLTTKGTIDPAYNSLIFKILEAKALDCLCADYSKQNTQQQLTKALAAIDQRVGENQYDSVSIGSSRSAPASYESPSVSSILTTDGSLSPRFVTPQSSNSKIISPSHSGTMSTSISPSNSKHSTKSSLKLNENIKTPRKKSKVTIVADKTSKSNKSRKKKKASSKPRKKTKNSSKKPNKSTSSTKRKTKPNKSTSSIKRKTKSKVPTKKQSLSKIKKKSSSKSPSRSKSSKKRQSTKIRNVRKKRTKSKSNNQVTDREIVMLQTFIYPQTYQEVYRNQQRNLKLILSST